ncbi:MAG: hypothetical protein COB73_05815 [Flavobacteriaceae bacterium]|nr:MAG: hypothetical protein COB73_05815 [Flavobacteriaceae bacterium]
MKNILLSSLFIVAVGFNSFATKNKINKEVSIVEINVVGLSTLCKLIQLGDVEGVKNLIENGTNINQKSKGMTPLMFAARQNKVEIVKLLLSRSAKLKTKSDSGMTALDFAERSKATESYYLIKNALEM